MTIQPAETLAVLKAYLAANPAPPTMRRTLSDEQVNNLMRLEQIAEDRKHPEPLTGTESDRAADQYHNNTTA